MKGIPNPRLTPRIVFPSSHRPAMDRLRHRLLLRPKLHRLRRPAARPRRAVPRRRVLPSRQRQHAVHGWRDRRAAKACCARCLPGKVPCVMQDVLRPAHRLLLRPEPRARPKQACSGSAEDGVCFPILLLRQTGSGHSRGRVEAHQPAPRCAHQRHVLIPVRPTTTAELLFPVRGNYPKRSNNCVSRY